ncbi:hypothetical protein NC652_027673 [Populus alba x Populus x berolinensis]|nr:hypothetical protein NC652_027673 [Populus alba x Populus x berolinensis]
MGSVSPTQKLPNILIPDHIGFWTANTIITLPARTTSEALPAAFATQVHYRLPLEQGTPLTPSPIVPYASLLISSLGWLRRWKMRVCSLSNLLPVSLAITRADILDTETIK